MDATNSGPPGFASRKPTEYRYVQGSIFDAFERAHVEAVVVFAQGMALAADAHSFVQELREVSPENENGIAVYRDDIGRFVVVYRDRMRLPRVVLELDDLVEALCAMLVRLGVKRVAMNDVRISGSYACDRLVREVEFWCNRNGYPLEQVFFVNLRGGFNKGRIFD